MQLPAVNASLPAVPQAPLRPPNAANTAIDPAAPPTQPNEPENTQANKTQPAPDARQTNAQQLTENDYRVIAELKKIDSSVRAHEGAHLAAAGGLARGGASFTYTQGPDGQRYAVGGEVSIDTSPVRDNPEATIFKAQRIQAAALAPAQPSDADRAVAAAAAQMAASARAALAAERYNTEESEPNQKSLEGTKNTDSSTENTTPVSEDSKRPTNAADKLSQLIQRVTSAEDALGNILNTAV